MLRPTYQWFAQMGAALGVIASLVLVAYELKQSQKVATADIYQQRSAMALAQLTSLYSPELLQQAHHRATYEPDAITITDLVMLRYELQALLIYFENEHFQYQIGMLSEEEWSAAKGLLVFELDNPCKLRVWRTSAEAWRDSFAAEVNAIVKSSINDTAECKLPTVEDLLPRV